MAIKLLDDDLINKIAAGEVIERPASIVKELIENSIDSGADRITVRIGSGGRELIEVEDNGQGISFSQVPLAFLRHATSKIKQEEDLLHISTLGFRGEALPSIASVSRVELYSQAPGEPGVYTCLEGGQQLVHQIHPSPPGTRIVVKDLFYNTPARKKFLKSTVTESNRIHELLCRYALVRPNISFSFSSDKKNYFKTPGNNSLPDTVRTIFGSDFAEGLMEISYRGGDYRIGGLISSPKVKRSNRRNQFVFVNQRPIKSPVIYRAIDQAYQGRLLSREHPVVILFLELEPSRVDVNVHPQKSEVRFSDEQSIFRVVLDVIRDKLEKSSYGVNINYLQSQRPGIIDPAETKTTGYDYLSEQPGVFTGQPLDNTEYTRAGEEAAGFDAFAHNSLSGGPEQIVQEDRINIIGQVFDSYILLQKDDSLWIADQHAAHEKVIFEQLRAQKSLEQPDTVQELLLPLTLELSSKQMDILETNRESLFSMGFELQAIGPNSIALRSVPLPAAGREKEVLYEIMDDLMLNRELPDLRRRVITIMSCKKAVKAGTRLSIGEMGKIIDSLLALEDYAHCPHGRPTIIRLTYDDLERMFKRR